MVFLFHLNFFYLTIILSIFFDILIIIFNLILMNFVTILLFFIISIQQCWSFIIEASNNYMKCFSAQHSPDKTLQVKFSFPRSQRQNCKVLFAVDIVQEGQIRESIYSNYHNCHQMPLNQPIIVKHTGQGYQLEGTYRICVQVLQTPSQSLYLQIFIGQKLNPMLYGNAQTSLPLIQSQQLISLDLNIQNIRRSIGWSRKLLEEGKGRGDKVEAMVRELQQFVINATILQALVLVAYAFAWVVLLRSTNQ